MISYLYIQACFVLKFFRDTPLSKDKTSVIVRYHLNAEDKIMVCTVLNKIVVYQSMISSLTKVNHKMEICHIAFTEKSRNVARWTNYAIHSPCMQVNGSISYCELLYLIFVLLANLCIIHLLVCLLIVYYSLILFLLLWVDMYTN